MDPSHKAPVAFCKAEVLASPFGIPETDGWACQLHVMNNRNATQVHPKRNCLCHFSYHESTLKAKRPNYDSFFYRCIFFYQILTRVQKLCWPELPAFLICCPISLDLGHLTQLDLGQPWPVFELRSTGHITRTSPHSTLAPALSSTTLLAVLLSELWQMITLQIKVSKVHQAQMMCMHTPRCLWRSLRPILA